MKNLLTGAVILVAANIIAVSAGYTETIIKTGTEGEQTFLESALPAAERSLIGDSLSDILNRKHSESGYMEDDEVLDVLAVLREENEVYNDPPEYGSATFDESGRAVVKINGRVVDKKEMEANTKKRYKRIHTRREARIKKRRYKLQKLADRNGLHNAYTFQKAMDNGRRYIKLPIKKDQLLEFIIKNKDIISVIDIYPKFEKTLDSAMIATNIDPWALNYWPLYTGKNIGIYMNDADTCPDPGYIPNYTKLLAPGNAKPHSELVSDVLRGVSPDSYIYCKVGLLPTSSDLNGYDGNPPIYIENHSYGSSTDNLYTTVDEIFDNHVYNNGISVFVAAGNDGGIEKYGYSVTTPAKGLNVISVGNYNHRDIFVGDILAIPADTIWYTSSFGDPETKNQKPEIVAPGRAIAARGNIDTGTSFATPHAAAFAADIMSWCRWWLTWRPAVIKAHMLAAATDSISGGADKVGVGGIDFLSNPWHMKLQKWWEGSNSDFSYFDSLDPYPNNGSLDYKVYLNVGGGEHEDNIRIALCWLNRGTYTFEHRNEDYPMGIDFTMMVLDPNLNPVGYSNSKINPYEVIDFTPETEGDYTISILMVRNDDTDSKLRIGMVVNPY
ncbi:MAG: S8 family serine peptidase [Desulfobacterales bacterium]|nr:S8 family serine peptidase [Desulfobacterales bacterium]